MHANLITESENQSGSELRAKGAFVGTIASINRQEMEKIGKPGVKINRGVMRFAEQGAKPWILNVTNREMLKAVFGDGRCGKAGSDKDHADGKCYETDHWTGHKIGLAATEQRVSGKPEDGIILAACDAVTAPMKIKVKLSGKGEREYIVKPFTKTPAGGAA